MCLKSDSKEKSRNTIEEQAVADVIAHFDRIQLWNTKKRICKKQTREIIIN